MSRFTLKHALGPLVLSGILFAAPTGSRAADSGAGDDWQLAAILYMWAPGINGSTAGGSEFDVSFDTLISNLNMTFMGAVEARKGPWSLLGDVIYLNAGGDGGGQVPVVAAPGVAADVQVDVKTRSWILNLIGGYNIWQSEQGSLDALLGARYLEMKVDFGLDLALGPFAISRQRSPQDTVVDGVMGVKGYLNINPKWYVPFYLDAGTGESELTWQASAGIAYRFNWGDVSLQYRHLAWEFASGDRLNDLSVSGPLLAAKFVF
jgi:hypothetical protein